MWLVLCAADDLPALWVFKGLQSRGLRPIEVLTPDVLVYNQHIVHRISNKGVQTEIVLADGRRINSSSVRGTINRIITLPTAQFDTAGPKDYAYAEQELYALFLSWLNGLPGWMINRPTPQCLSGAWLHPIEWTSQAAQVDLPTAPYLFDELHPGGANMLPSGGVQKTVIVYSKSCFGVEPPESIQAGCVRLAEMENANLLGVHFLVFPNNEWVFYHASSHPDLRWGGEALLDALANSLSEAS